jgi:hypothetical protein
MDVENTEPQQTEAPPDTETGGPVPGTPEDLLDALREAGGTAIARDEVAADAEAAGDPPVEPAVEEEPRIAAVLKAREKAQAEREAARNEAEEYRARARQEAEEWKQQAIAEAKAEVERERQKLRDEFRANPTATLRALGDPTEISDAVMREGTPEARAQAQIQRELAETKQLAQSAAEAKKELETMRAEIAREKHEAALAKVRADFLSAASKESAPYLHARYDEDEIFEKADRQARAWQKQGLKLGSDFDFKDITQYLELDAKKRLTAVGVSPSRQVSEGAPAKEPGLAPKVPANGSRTLSAAQGSERRTSPRPLSEMTPDEQRAALIEEVAAARRANPGAKT